MKRILAILLTAIMAGGALTGCLGAGNTATSSAPAAEADSGDAAPAPASGDDADDEAAPVGDVDYEAAFEMRFIGSLAGDERSTLLEEAAERLSAKWPNVTVVNECTSDYADKMKLAFSSGEGQQLAYLDDLNQQILEEGGYLMDITADIEARGWISKSIEGSVEFNNLRHPGQNYSVPFLMAPILVYYNKDIFAEIGVTETPKTTAEFEEILRRAKDAGYIPTESSGDLMYQIMWMVQNMVQNIAPKSEVDDWYYRRNASDNVKDAFIEAHTLVKGWVDAGYFRDGFEGTRGDDIITLFSQGQTAMTVDGDWSLPDMELSGLNLGAFVFPPVTASESPFIVNAVDGAWALNANLDANQKACALDWIDIFFQQDYVQKWYEIGFTPSVVGDYSGAQVSALKSESATAVEGTQMGFYLDNVKPGYLDFLTKQTQLLVQGELTPETMWDAMDEEWGKAE